MLFSRSKRKEEEQYRHWILDIIGEDDIEYRERIRKLELNELIMLFEHLNKTKMEND